MKKEVDILILVAEDERATATRLNITKRRSKYNLDIKIVEYAEEFEKEFEENKNLYSIVFLDQNLKTSKDRQGVDLAWNINKDWGNGVPVFMLSSATGRVDHIPKLKTPQELIGISERDAAEKAGAMGWIEKGGKIIEKIDWCIDNYVGKDNSGKEFVYLDDKWDGE